jgi:hypothetical protein
VTAEVPVSIGYLSGQGSGDHSLGLHVMFERHKGMQSRTICLHSTALHLLVVVVAFLLEVPCFMRHSNCCQQPQVVGCCWHWCFLPARMCGTEGGAYYIAAGV